QPSPGEWLKLGGRDGSQTPDHHMPDDGRKRSLLGNLRHAQDTGRRHALAKLDARCSLLLGTLRRAGIEANRVEGPELASLCDATWGIDFTPTRAISMDSTDLSSQRLDAWVRQPAGMVEYTKDWVKTPAGYVRSWYFRDFSGRLDEAVITRLA